jgi:hypothetical protein
MSRFITAFAAALASGAAHAQHLGDISLEIVNGTIVTNAYGTSGTAPERVFGATFGDTGVARFTSNPGFEALPGTFATGTRVGFTPRSGLLRFTGSAVEPVAAERLEIKFLTLASVVGPDPVPGFSLAVQSNGGWHRHLSFTLFAESGKLPSSGLYVVEFELYSNDGVTLPSEPFWIVFNDGKPAVELNAALAWVESNLVGDAPACPADLDGDGDVGAADLGILLSGWGTPTGDIDGDGLADSVDLGQLLSAWGGCQ